MNKVILTDVIISKGFDGKAAIRFNTNKTAVNFKIGKLVYDKTAKDNHRYMNIAVKAFSQLCERIEKMQLKEGSRINIAGKLDEENWEENGQKFSRFVIIAEEIEYASSDPNKSNGNGANGAGSAPPANGNGQGAAAPQNSPVSPPDQPPQNSEGMPSGFGGYESFDMNDGSANDLF
jgi:single-stranded DNA-binding protein